MRLPILLLLFWTGLWLAACQSDPQDGQVRITMWDIPESEAYTEWWRDYIDQFNAMWPLMVEGKTE